ncbi:hypothetical protein T484DRAFT_1782789, partial [Baffinella frigidus]
MCDTLPEKSGRDKQAMAVLSSFGQRQLKLAPLCTNGVEEDPHALCRACWLAPTYCICASAGQLHVSLDYPVDILVYMNINEFARKSNTGSLALLAAPALHGQLLVAGHPDHERALEQALARRGNIAVLFPSPDALSLPEWVARLSSPPSSPRDPPARDYGGEGGAEAPCDGGGNAACTEAGGGGERAMVVLLDGTWSQARKLN